MNVCPSQITLITIFALMLRETRESNEEMHYYGKVNITIIAIVTNTSSRTAHKATFWYIFARVKWPTQRAYFREAFRKGEREARADICSSLTPENPGRSALLRTIGRFSNGSIHDRRHFLSPSGQIRVSAHFEDSKGKKKRVRGERTIHGIGNSDEGISSPALAVGREVY